MMKSTADKILDWATGRGVGASSKCMAAHLTGREHDKSHPHDGGDFGRCLSLLDAAPELRERVDDMATVSKQWAALVKNWDAIEKKVRANDDDTYKFMSGILRPIDDTDPNVTHISDGVTMRVGR